MKKSLSLLLVITILFTGFIPIIASGKEPNYESPIYKYNGKIHSDAYELIDMDDPDFRVIAGKNINKKEYPASLTKIITAIVVLNNTKNLNKITTVKRATLRTLDDTDAMVAGLKPGQKVKIKQLLNLMMIYSACDAARVLATTVGGCQSGFVKMMNRWVKSIGCKKTHFVNADGLHHTKHYTTASDLRLIMKEACKNKIFLKISCKHYYVFNKTKFYHTNQMLNKSNPYEYYQYAKGIKTGFTTPAQKCVITYSIKNAKKYLVICLHAPVLKVKNHTVNGALADARALFNWSYKNFKKYKIVKANQPFSDISVENGAESNTVTLCFQKDVKDLIYGKFNQNKLLVKPINLPESIPAPVEAGEIICKARIYYNNYYVKTVSLIANCSIKKAESTQEEPITEPIENNCLT